MNERVLLRFLAAALLPLGVVACNATEGEEAGDEVQTLAAVGRANLDIMAEASGLVEPIRIVEVKSKASGEVLRLHVETGMTVEQGALLAEVDPRDVNNAFAQAEADLAVARERLATAVAQSKRTQELRAASVVTAQELESATLEEANARAQLVKAQTNLDLARERRNDVAIRAPIAGTIISKTVEQGTIIASASQNISGGTTLFTMADLAVMQVRALVDETDIGRIRPGQVTQVAVEAYPDRRFRGTVYKIEPQAVVEQNVTMFPVLVRLDNPEGLLKPGMNADITVEIARRENVLTVPNAAIVAMADAAAAGAVLGLDEEDVMTALRGRGRGGQAGGPAEGPGAAQGERPQGGEQAAAANGDGNRGGEQDGAAADARRPGGPVGERPAAAEQLAQAPAGPGAAREGAGATQPGPAGDAARRMQGGMRGAAGGGAAGGGPGGFAGRVRNPDVRPAVVFVQGASGPEPRRVMVGLNDWDNTEVISGVEEGEQVILVSVARLQAQQEEFAARLRERAGSPLTGGGPMGGPGGPGGRGGPGGGRGGR